MLAGYVQYSVYGATVTSSSMVIDIACYTTGFDTLQESHMEDTILL